MATLNAMKRPLVLLVAALCAFGAHAQQPAKPAAKAPAKKAATSPYKPVVEPRAMDLIKAMSERLAAAKSMSFTATVGYEFPSKLGPPLLFTTRYEVAMQRPDKLRVINLGDGPVSELYFDGRTITAFAPNENLAAVMEAPGTVESALQSMQTKASTFYPFIDVVAADPYKAFTNKPIEAFVIGKSSSVGGVATNMVAWANKDVFMQMWIGVDDKLPYRIRATFSADKLRLRHELHFSDWKIDPTFPPETFASAKAQSAGKMSFAPPAPPPKGVKSIVPAQKSK